MKRLSAVLGVFVALGLLGMIPLGCSDSGSGSSTPSNLSTRINVLFAEKGTLAPVVQSAGEGTVSASDQSWEYTLTLENVSEEMLWYTDRPGRKSGTETIEYFVQTVWPAVFVDIAPNAILDGWIPPNVLNDGLFLILRDPLYDSKLKKLTFTVILENSTMDDKHPEATVDFEDIKITVLNNNEDGKTDTYSFVQVAPSAYFEETGTEGVYTLYLNDVYPESYYLADAPDRFSFVYPVELFELAWPNLFGDDPPNASMTSYTDSGELKVQIVTLDHPDYDEGSNVLTYTATLLHGKIENNQTLNSPTLFIDAADSASCEDQMGGKGFTKRVTIINACGKKAWLYMTYPTVIPAQWDFWQKTCGKEAEVVWTGGKPGAGDKMVRLPLETGNPYHFCIPDRGAASGNFRVFLEPCKKTGDDCMIGTIAGEDRAGIFTLFEASFGCIPTTAHDVCAINPAKQSERLTAVDWFDISAVDGFTIPMYLQVTNAHKLTCTRSFTDASMLDMASCPREESSTLHALDTADQELKDAIKNGFSLLTQSDDGYQCCASPCKWFTGHELGNPTNPIGPMNPDPGNTPNTASWYCCACCGRSPGPGTGPKECDQGPDGVDPISGSGYVHRLKELGLLGYSWQFDDHTGLMNCTQTKTGSATIVLTLCPLKATGALYPRPAGSKPYLKTHGWNWVNGKCTANNNGGSYKSLFECQKAKMQYKCTKVQSGENENAVYHNYCLPVETGGQSYEDCKKSCY